MLNGHGQGRFECRDPYHLTLNLGGGGANMPHSFSAAYSSGTECRIDLKLGCKFEFVRWLETYLKKLFSLGHEGTLPGPFLPRVLRN